MTARKARTDCITFVEIADGGGLLITLNGADNRRVAVVHRRKDETMECAACRASECSHIANLRVLLPRYMAGATC